jgi:hypothetical protein
MISSSTRGDYRMGIDTRHAAPSTTRSTAIDAFR